MNPPHYRTAVVNLLHDASAPGMAQLVSRTQLDLLQLDYHWPTSGFIPTAPANQWAGYARGLLPLVTELQRLLYLTPEPRLITNAGAAAPQHCAEVVSNCLCEHGNARIPVTAIRGTDILAQLEELIVAGADLSNLQTGAPLETLQQPIGRAQVEVGAGPIATALADGARLVIAGAYCPSAPLIAASRQHFGWSTGDLDTLAGTLVTARLARLGPVELDADGSCRLLAPDASAADVHGSAPRPHDIQALRDSLFELDHRQPSSIHTDVACDLSHLQLEPTAAGDVLVSGVRGRTSDETDHWPVTLWYQSHYTTRVLVEIPQSYTGTLAATLHALSGDVFQVHESQGLSLERLLPLELSAAQPAKAADTGNHEIVRLQVSWHSPDRAACEEWSQQLTTWVGCQPGHQVRLLEPWPELRWHWAPWYTQVPRELITLAVDTRLAEDWRAA